jgi:hypothetical protein
MQNPRPGRCCWKPCVIDTSSLPSPKAKSDSGGRGKRIGKAHVYVNLEL